MGRISWKRILGISALLLGVWLGVKYLLPVAAPFLLGLGIALAAEPAVRFAQTRLHLKRGIAAPVSVGLLLLLLVGALSLVGALTVKELGNLAGALPDVRDTVQQGMSLLQEKAMQLAHKLPAGAESLVSGTVTELFGSGSVLLQKLTRWLTDLLTALLGWLPDGALGLGTGILSAFMISVRLPKLKAWAAERIPGEWKEKYVPALGRVRKSLGSWLKAQGSLLLVTYGVVSVGFLLLGIPYGPVWAALVAMVDAVPILGTGTVLLPWALVELLQGQPLRAIGLLLTYGAAFLLRTTLEPKLVGKHLGLDPLLTLVFLYIGYRFWGILGMILAPMLAAATKGLTETAG